MIELSEVERIDPILKIQATIIVLLDIEELERHKKKLEEWLNNQIISKLKRQI